MLASSGTALVTSDANSVSSAYMGCLRSDGRERFLERLSGVPGLSSSTVSAAGVGDGYAALANFTDDLHYGDTSDTVEVFDLSTGAPAAGLGGQGTGCSGAFGSDSGCDSGIDQVVVGTDGVSAAHVLSSIPPGSPSPDPP